MNTMIKASILAIAIAFTAGCSQTSEMQTAIEDLAVRVAVLESGLDDVAVAAVAAQDTADAAARAAQQSQDCCDATNEKIDRMFKQSQSK
jgi:outer membrane murein-binding lipoprotein Lpp